MTYPRVGSKWDHKKGGTYIVTGLCMMETTWTPGILYTKVGDSTGIPVARDAEEFLDGRFTEVTCD